MSVRYIRPKSGYTYIYLYPPTERYLSPRFTPRIPPAERYLYPPNPVQHSFTRNKEPNTESRVRNNDACLQPSRWRAAGVSQPQHTGRVVCPPQKAMLKTNGTFGGKASPKKQSCSPFMRLSAARGHAIKIGTRKKKRRRRGVKPNRFQRFPNDNKPAESTIIAE